MTDVEDRRSPTNAELFRVLTRIEEKIDGNGRPGLLERVTSHDSYFKIIGGSIGILATVVVAGTGALIAHEIRFEQFVAMFEQYLKSH